ncbi:TPA: hypothetical protein ACTUNV_000482 [Legionella pneumophila]
MPDIRLMKVKSGIDEETLLGLIESKSRASCAYVFSEDNKFYFYHEDDEPKLKEVPIDKNAIKKILDIAILNIEKRECDDVLFVGGCKLHLMNDFPKDISTYEDSYVFTLEKGTRKLHYIKPGASIECYLYSMSQLPKSLERYKNSYILIEVNNAQELYYIKPDGESEKVKIDDVNLFKKKINDLNKRNLKILHLSEKQIEEIVTSNGGHTPEKKYEEVKILDFNTFENQIDNLRSKGETEFNLSEEQIRNIITSNGGHTPFPLGGKKISQVRRELTKSELKTIYTLSEHAPYSSKELRDKSNLLVLRNFFLEYLSKIQSQDKTLVKKLWGDWRRDILSILDGGQKEIPLSSDEQEAINRLDAAVEHQVKTSTHAQKLSSAPTSLLKGIYSFFKSANLQEIVSAYFSKEPEEQDKGTYAQENHNALGFKLSMFHFLSGASDRWIRYERTKPPINEIDEFDWKFNLSIHKDDVSRAFPIIAEVANQMNLGLFKIMCQAQANRVQNNDLKTMIGRELVIYRNANPELSAAQWIDILIKIEERFKEAGIRTSTDTCPASNRKLGKYVSYTHGAWTDERMDVPFAEGIKETALEDEDLFADYGYDEATKAPTKKSYPKKPR